MLFFNVILLKRPVHFKLIFHFTSAIISSYSVLILGYLVSVISPFTTTSIIFRSMILVSLQVYPKGQNAKHLKREPKLDKPGTGGLKYYDSVKVSKYIQQVHSKRYTSL